MNPKAILARAVPLVLLALLVLAIAFLPASALAADPLGELRAVLRKAENGPPIRAQISIMSVRKSSDEGDGQRTTEEGTVLGEHDAAGLRLTWTAQQIRTDRQADWRRAATPDAAEHKDGGLGLLDAKKATELLDPAEVLRLEIEGAKLTADKTEPRNGRPTRVLVLEPRDGLNARDRKSLKSRDEVLKIWLDPSGQPIATERTAKLKFSKFLITFEVSQHETRTLARAGGRLYVSFSVEVSGGSGLGQSGETQKTFRVTPVG
ncbi:MAG TPA: hypothetical protein VGS22_27910 [Thermoanaerobaculia bacterium]|jgi:hypothetical protein|nr:hypothetical protein [Thermoanaerobaculia bacterium]